MVISFDLDDTLIPGQYRFETQRRYLLHRICGLEPLRRGAVELIWTLQARGHKIFIYTTSFRSVAKIRWMLLLYGIRVDEVINQTIHQNTLRERAKDHSKYPPAFSIDVHIDDLKGVELEGQRHHFKTIIIPGADPQWSDFVLQQISLLE